MLIISFYLIFLKRENKELEEVVIPICSSGFKVYLADFLSPSIHPLPGLKTKKKTGPKKILYCLGKGTLSSKNEKLYPEKNTLIHQETKTPKKLLKQKIFFIFQETGTVKRPIYPETDLSDVLGERRYLELWPSESFLILQERNI